MNILGWLYRETNGYEKVFFVAGGTMFFSFLLLCPVHFMSKAPSDSLTVNAVVRPRDEQEQNIELMNITDGVTEKNVLLQDTNRDVESDVRKSLCNCGGDRERIL